MSPPASAQASPALSILDQAGRNDKAETVSGRWTRRTQGIPDSLHPPRPLRVRCVNLDSRAHRQVARGLVRHGVVHRVEPGFLELDAALLPHGEVARQGDDGVGQGDLAPAAGPELVVGRVVEVARVAVADAVGEVLELLAIAS